MQRANSVRGKGFDFDAYIESRRELVEAALEGALDALEAPEPLAEAMRYAVLGPGKRLRPLMVLAAAEAVSVSDADLEEIHRAALPLACAVELVHAYSLVHDDLPAMDDDDLRRGRPTLHRAFDEATAILAGDALLTEAFRLVGRARGLKRSRRCDAVVALAEAAGTTGMVGGQMLDLVAEGRYRQRAACRGERPPLVDAAGLELLASWKTGALIAGSAVLGGIAGGAGRATQKRLSEYGACTGLAFQIADDLLDEEGSAEAIGKATRKDAAKGKLTFPRVLGAKAAHRKAEALTAKSVRLASTFAGEGGAALAGIATWAVERDR